MQQNPGSPPRMRGKVSGQRRFYGKAGITPAYAGKSICRDSCNRGFQDHPRVCGEKPCLPEQQCLRQGSPPRMRGKVAALIYAVSDPGITPAYAGKRQARHFSRRKRRDHPRVCGEKTKKIP